jgi:branched-chain amino acid transport system permease protein
VFDLGALAEFGFWAFVLTAAGINAVFVLGLQIEVGETGLVNFGHVAFMAVGAYGMGLLLVRGVPVWLALPLAVLGGALLGLLLGVPTLRLRADYFAITTIAAGEILRLVILNEDRATGGPQGLLGASGPWREFNRDVLAFFDDHLGWEVHRRVPLLVLVWLAAGLVALLLWHLARSPWGRVLRAVREDEDAAAAVGKPVFAFKLQALALGGAVGALAGVFFTFFESTLFPEDFLPIVTFTAFAILILGGFGSYFGVLLASVAIAIITAGTRFLTFPLDPDKVASLRFVVIGLLIMAVMAFRPQGLLGKRAELHLDG